MLICVNVMCPGTWPVHAHEQPGAIRKIRRGAAGVPHGSQVASTLFRPKTGLKTSFCYMQGQIASPRASFPLTQRAEMTVDLRNRHASPCLRRSFCRMHRASDNGMPKADHPHRGNWSAIRSSGAGTALPASDSLCLPAVHAANGPKSRS